MHVMLVCTRPWDAYLHDSPPPHCPASGPLDAPRHPLSHSVYAPESWNLDTRSTCILTVL